MQKELNDDRCEQSEYVGGVEGRKHTRCQSKMSNNAHDKCAALQYQLNSCTESI